MIRLISRRLIIPRGDTGSFTVPLLQSDFVSPPIAVFSIFNLLTSEVIYQQNATIENGIVTVTFEHENTKVLPLGQYVWDIKIYTNPEYKDGKLINGETVDSYYAGFTYPICEITLSRDRKVRE